MGPLRAAFPRRMTTEAMSCKPGCWRTWTWDNECARHHGWDQLAD